MMRAFMSTDYPRYTHLCAYAPPNAAPGHIDEWLENDKALKAFTAEAAVSEARAILAATEPNPRPTCDHGPKRIRNPRAQGRLIYWRNVRALPVYQDVAYDARRSLAEALAAFVGDGNA